MKISNSALQFEASHSQMRQHEISESLRISSGNRPLPSAGGTAADTALPRVNISDAGRAAQAGEATALDKGVSSEDPKLSIMRALLARMTGKDVDVVDKSALSAAKSASNAGGGVGVTVEYDRHESYTETEQMSFSANGVVRTADGKSIAFEMSLSMERSYHEESSVSIRMGSGGNTCDPLVINFNGNAAQLIDQRFAFDLNADGEASERINFLASGSGFLAFDRNGDGKINDGSELFGARTGDGFAELAALDGDRNGWIDESDAAYSQLSVWIKNASGAEILRSLKEANVGAISVSRASTPFSIKDANNNLEGQVRASGVYLRENGGVGSVQQVDLTV
ncbi:MAG: VCBS repeat-containing protein [Candidatus Accumulibacter sp.]|nr:VCBS repeat-containing protein [Accumulibacter sp.]